MLLEWSALCFAIVFNIVGLSGLPFVSRWCSIYLLCGSIPCIRDHVLQVAGFVKYYKCRSQDSSAVQALLPTFRIFNDVVTEDIPVI